MSNVSVKPFNQLTRDELYAIMKLRFEVFVLEQKCFYNEFDNIDYSAYHVMMLEEKDLIGYARFYQRQDGQVGLGRILIAQHARSKGHGQKLIDRALRKIALILPKQSVQISAQEHLESFYGDLGFIKISAPYDDEGIMHIDMKLDRAIGK